MSAFAAAAQDEDGDTISALRAENEQLRQALLTANDTLVKASQAGAHHARAAECLRKTVIRWAARAEQAEEMLEAIGAGGVGSKVARQDHHEQHLNMVPEGWKLVPVEPTIPMLHRADGLTCIDFAALGEEGAFDLDELKEIYRAMLAAAPQPPVVEHPQGTRHETAIPDKLASQAIDALASYCNTGEIEGADDLLASLLYSIEHSQQPAMNHIAQRKLDFLLADGWAISGYSICKLSPSSEMRHGFVTAGGLVGWWQQPQVEQEPVAWQYRMRPDWGSKKDCWGPWQDCTKEQAAMYQRVPLLHDWAYESRQLYTYPHPWRELRSEQEIVDQTEKLAELFMALFQQRVKEDSSTTMRGSSDMRAQHCWTVACRVQEMLTQTDPENAAAELDRGNA